MNTGLLKHCSRGALLLAALLISSGRAWADPQEDLLLAIPWTTGPARGEMGRWAVIDVPEGFAFTGPEGCPQFLELTENSPDPNAVGVLMPTDDSTDWVVYFTYDDSGHVNDDERDSIDADALLAALRAGNEAANEAKRARGWEGLRIIDWLVPPGYETSTNRLVWGVRLQQDSGTIVANYEVRVLGRTGVMQVTLACRPEEMERLVPRLQELLNGFEFKSGHRYAEWRAGDKAAAYGLTGLIVGGAAVGAAKAGLFAKLFAVLAKGGKIIAVAVAAAVAGLWKLLTGGKKKESATS